LAFNYKHAFYAQGGAIPNGKTDIAFVDLVYKAILGSRVPSW